MRDRRIDGSLRVREVLGWVLRRNGGGQRRVETLVGVGRRLLVGWWRWNDGRNRLLVMDVEVFDLGRRDNQCVTIILALDPHLPQGDILAGNNLFDFASQTDTVLEADVHGRAHPLSTFGRHG